MARIDTSDHRDKPWVELHEATIRWNTARLAAALIAPANEIRLLLKIDAETDVLMDKALDHIWASREFRREREQLGRLGAEYLNLVRKNENLAPLPLESLWAWDEQRLAIEARPKGEQPSVT